MKFFKYSALALALAAGFTSCSDEEDYVIGAESAGVYFPTDDALDVTLDRAATSFDVIVSRMGETAAATYALTGAADDEVFTLPASVAFAEGETTTTVSVGYIPGNMAYDRAYTVILGFAEGVKVCNYGYETLEMAVLLPAPWKSLGMGTYRDMWVLPFYGIHSDKDPELVNEWEVELQQHEIEPTRYRWLHPYGENFAKYCAATGIGEFAPGEYDDAGKYNIEFVVDAQGNAVVPFGQLTGVTVNEEDGMVIAGTLGGYYYSAGKSISWILANVPEGVSSFNATEGQQTFMTPAGSRVGDFTNDGEGPYIPTFNPGGYLWWSNNVTIADTDIKVSYTGVLTTPDEESYALADITLGEDIDKAVAGLVKTNEEEVALAAIRNGEVETKELTEKSNPGVRFEFDGSGDYLLVVIGYDAEGKEVNSAMEAIFVADNAAPKEWEEIGTGQMIDAWITPAFQYEDGTRVDPMDEPFAVVIENNIENPGVYRLKAPFTSPAYPNYEANPNKTTKYNIVIDARDPKFVRMTPQNSGFEADKDKYIFISTIATYREATGTSEGAIKLKKEANTLVDGLITIPLPLVGFGAPDATVAADKVTGSYYGEGETPCPAYIALPGAELPKASAAAKMRSTASRLEARFTNGTIHTAAVRVAESNKHIEFVRSAKKL